MNPLHDWLQATVLFAIALVAIMILGKFLGRISNRERLGFLEKLVPSVLGLAYVIALSMFLHAAPLPPRTETLVENGMYVVIVWVAMLIIRRAVLAGVEVSVHRAHTGIALQQGFLPLLKNIATLFVFATGGIMVFRHFGYDVMSLLTALGVGSLAVGLAAKEALSNMISGFVLIMDGNVHPGDRINLGSFTGDVEEIGLRSTKIKTGDGNTMIVPNFDLVNNRILNYSLPSRAGTCSTSIRVPYGTSFESVKEICLHVLEQVPQADQGKGKWVNLSSVSAGYQEIAVGWWLRDIDDQGEALTQFHRRLLGELEQKSMPMIDAVTLAGLRRITGGT